MPRPKKVKPSSKFTEDLVSSAVTSKYGEVVRTGTEVLESINSLQVIGVSPALDMALGGGLREGSVVVMTGDPKSGKEQPVSSTVYTPSGPVAMGDVDVGCKVCTPSGGTATVVDVFPQGVKDVYLLTFSDGTSAECGLDHLWKVRKNYHGKRDWGVKSLKSILDEGLRFSDRPKWSVPLVSLVEFDEQELPLDPYILGCLIGDGGFSGRGVRFTTTDQELVNNLKSFAENHNLSINKVSGSEIDYQISSDGTAGSNAVTNALKNLNLMGLTSKEKFIPYLYKHSSSQQRIELIRGLMDTDGYNATKFAEYATSSQRLSEDVAYILRSLGYKAVVSKRTTKCDGKEFPSYRIYISGNGSMSHLFSLERKKSSYVRSKPPLVKHIVKVERVRSEESKCIMLDSHDHLYVTDNMTVTHNTTTALHFAAKCQKLKKRIIYVNTEGRLSKQNFDGIRGLDSDKILIVESTDDRVLSAEDFLNIIEYYIHNDPGCVIICDSLSNMVPSCELEGDVRTGVRNALPRLLSMFFKRISGSLMKNKTILIAVTHNIANTGGSPYAPQKMADCGNMLQYQAGTNMVITHVGRWQVPKDSGPHVGQIANWRIKTSNAGGTPNSTAASWIRYGIGLDEVQEVLQAACEFRLIKTAGAWYTIQCAVNNPTDPAVAKVLADNDVDTADPEAVEKFFKFQGANNTCDFLTENPDVADFVYKQIGEMFA